ncbi:hypothetical protein BC830DRAFT_469806 [Chytriomyces sp. MP71]|nr:hypothetical protein BC830DRAFT_469806 [Chytriomyces sp. MP71]
MEHVDESGPLAALLAEHWDAGADAETQAQADRRGGGEGSGRGEGRGEGGREGGDEDGRRRRGADKEDARPESERIGNEALRNCIRGFAAQQLRSLASPVSSRILASDIRLNPEDPRSKPTPTPHPAFAAVSLALSLALATGSPSHLVASIFLLPLSLSCLQYARARSAQRSLQNTILSFKRLQIETVAFDHACHKAFKWIQEVELVSRGFHISAGMPVLSNIEKSSKLLQSQLLRNLIKTLLEANVQTVVKVSQQLEHGSSPISCYRFATSDDIEDLKIIRAARSQIPPNTLEGLKLAMLELKLHRIWFLHRISVPSEDEFLRDTTTRHGFSLLAGSLDGWSQEVQQSRSLIEAELDSHLTFSLPFCEPTKHITAPFQSSLALLHKSLRSATIKLSLLSEDTSDPHIDETKLKERLNSIRLDIQELPSLMSACEVNLQSQFHLNPVATVVSDASHYEDSVIVNLASCDGRRDFEDTSVELPGIGDEVVFEDTVQGDSCRKVVPRAERIAVQKQKREEEATQKAAIQLSMQLVSELKTILNFRKPEKEPNKSGQ